MVLALASSWRFRISLRRSRGPELRNFSAKLRNELHLLGHHVLEQSGVGHAKIYRASGMSGLPKFKDGDQGVKRLQAKRRYRLEGVTVGWMESGSDVLVVPARVDCLVKWQDASGLIAATEPRKLFAPVRSRSKHTSNGSPLIRAQMASPLTRSVPGGSVAYCGTPLPPKRIAPRTEPSALTRPSPDVPSKHVNENGFPTTNRRASSAPMFPAATGIAAQTAATANSAHAAFIMSSPGKSASPEPSAFTPLQAIWLRANHPAHGVSWSGVDLR
jgi:hypothetical protein